MNSPSLEQMSKVIRGITDATRAPQPRTNAHRANEAGVLMDAMWVMTGVDPDPEADGPQTALTDVLAHLMHYADAHGIDFDICATGAAGHYRDETEEAGQ
jgi:hypothetical protein